MRIHFDGLVRPKLVAKSLLKVLTAGGMEIALSRCQSVVARMFGYRDWHDLARNHAEAPASHDDAIVGPVVSAERLLQYGRALASLGLEPKVVSEILGAVRPTDRSSGAPTAGKPSAFPRLEVEAFETDGEGQRIGSLGLQDITWQIVSAMVRPGVRGVDLVTDIEMPPRMIQIHSALSDRARVVGFEGRLAMPGFEEKLREFLDAVGPRDLLPEFKRRMERVTSTRSAIKSAKSELREVRDARFTTRAADFEMFHASHGSCNHEFVGNPSEAYDDWKWDAYVAAHPRPNWQDEPAMEAWNAAYAAWRRSDAPTWVFGTIKEPWKGIDAADIRECAEDGGQPFNVENLIDDSLSEHHEDARDHVVDDGDIFRIASSWWPHAGTGSPEDASLEGAVEAWNARQTISSYFPDARVILPIGPGLTQADAVGWCERRVSKLEQDLSALMVWDAGMALPGQEPDGARP